MRKIFVVGDAIGYINWMQGHLVNRMEDADLVVFTGGEDVSPDIYNEPAHPRTGCNPFRDKREAPQFHKAVELGKQIVGICRGSQFVCAMSGGKLVQHQENPHYMHPIKTYDGNVLEITSTHHQAQLPWNLPEDEYTVLAWTNGISRFHEDGNMKEIPEATDKCECEIVYYHKTKALGIQGHPEMMYYEDHPTILWLQNLLNNVYNPEFLAATAE